MEQDKISIIIPVYNIHEYLDRCLRSIVCQTYTNLEIILVDDGSTDGSDQICDEWAAKDDRVQCIHQANLGVSTARNHGLAQCTGDYILFIDGDDTVAPGMCEKMCKEMADLHLDVCICGFCSVEGHNTRNHCASDKKILDTAELLEVIFTKKDVFSAVWNKMFRRSALLDQYKNFVLFPIDISLGEDQLWLVRILKNCKKGVVIPETLYYWTRREGSASYTKTVRLTGKKNLTVLDADECCVNEISDKRAKYAAYKKYLGDILASILYAYRERNNVDKNELINRYIKARKLWPIITSFTAEKDAQVFLILAGIPYCILSQLKLVIAKKKQEPESLEQRAIIITIYDLNIGNRLQNYAVQNVIQKLGYQVATVRYPSEYVVTLRARLKKIIHQLTGYRLAHNRNYWESLDLRRLRIKTFEAFNDKYIHTQKVRKISQVQAADYYILGSDQVWNPAWYSELKKDLFLLTFAKPEQKICFAPSFGVEELPEEWKPWFRKYIADIPRLSVREDAGAKIIKELTGKEAAVLIDPTLMLDRDQWDEISVKPAKIDTDKPYILTYFLGRRSNETEQAIKQYADQIHAAVYHLLNPKQPEVYATGPSEFLCLVAHAKLILTDSFHACVFSFLYGKPFLVYNRQDNGNMMSRIETLLHKFNLDRKYAESGLENDLLECDYESGYEILEEERKKALHFLKVSIKMETE